MMRASVWHASGVFAAAFVIVSYNVWATGTASGWIDPILHFGAQDEATYTSEAIHMVVSGEWLTPKLLGRWIFEKPPMVAWLSGVSMKLFGIGRFAPRVPALIAGALIVALCFVIAHRTGSLLTAITAAVLAASDQVLFTLARRNMTDILLAAALIVVVAVLASDPSLKRRRSRVVFVIAIAAAILTKSVAGLLPAAAALLFAAVHPKDRSLHLRRTALLIALAMAAASPWFLYQFFAHRQWFLADLGFQVVTIGVKARQTSPENHVLFYALRVICAEPAGTILFLSAIPALILSLRRRAPVAILLTCFFGVLCVAVALFRFHSEQYLTPLMPIFVLIAAIWSPLARGRISIPLIAALVAIGILKAAHPEAPWGISYRAGSTIPAAGALSEYCEQRRGNDLYIIGVEDEFYALALPLARVRYGWLDPGGAIAESRPYLVYLGIVQRADENTDPAIYAERLRDWGFRTTEPLGTAITARGVAEFVPFILKHPESDFLVSTAIANLLPARDPHQRRAAGHGYLFLESPEERPGAAARWTCHM